LEEGKAKQPRITEQRSWEGAKRNLQPVRDHLLELEVGSGVKQNSMSHLPRTRYLWCCDSCRYVPDSAVEAPLGPMPADFPNLGMQVHPHVSFPPPHQLSVLFGKFHTHHRQ
jgi:hypothetical protein